MNLTELKHSIIRSLGGVPGRKKRLSRELLRQPPFRVRMEMKELNMAAEGALDIANADRIGLLAIYFRSWKDSQVIAEHEKAVSYLITEPFEVCLADSGKEDKRRTRLFQRPWFTEFLTIAMDTEFWGYQLAEFGEMDQNGEFTDVHVFPREHVRPFEKTITKYPGDTGGVPYGGKETAYFLIELGDPEELGKLESISREIIWKTFARSDWSEYNEQFGKPFITYKTPTSSEEEKDAALSMAQDFGRNLIGVIDDGEELNVTPVSSKASSDNYENLAKFCDDQIAKMMNGQTGTGDVKAFTGSAEVHERVLTEFTKARLKRIQDIVNYKLFPFLMAHGYKLDGYEFRFYGLQDKSENSVDNKSFNRPDPEKNGGSAENRYLGFFGDARKA